MGLKEWGQGQEQLVEFYYRYAKEHPKYCQWLPTGAKIGEKLESGYRSPVEIDQICLLVDDNKCSIEEIHAVQCKESIKGYDDAKKVFQSFSKVDTVKSLFYQAQRKQKFKRVVTFVDINDTAEKTLKAAGVELLPVKNIVSKIKDFYNEYQTRGRKSYACEPMGWILRTLSITKPLFDVSLENQNGKGKMNPQMLSDRANRAWKTMRSIPWLKANKNTKKAKQILHKNPRLVEKLRVK